MTEPIHIISLGAGVQSSCMSFMAALGEITPMPAGAVFADTGDEPSEVYDYLSYLEALLPFPIYRVQRSRLSDHICEWGQSQIPSFIPGGIGKRQCTKHWKIVPIQTEYRRLAGITGKRTNGDICVIGWQGISTDEVSRAKDSREHWLKARFPLLEKGMSRWDCLNWFRLKGLKEPPKSACVFCPYRSPSQWRASKAKGGSEWALILKVSTEIAARGEYLTDECRPIEQCDFSSEEDRGQLNLFNNECEGMCGV